MSGLEIAFAILTSADQRLLLSIKGIGEKQPVSLRRSVFGSEVESLIKENQRLLSIKTMCIELS